MTIDQTYGLRKLFYDPYQAEQMAQNLAAEGVMVEGVPFTVGTLTEMASAVLERFHDRTIDLYADDGLLTDLHGLRLIDRGATYRLDSARTAAGHGDRGTAFCLAVLAAARYPAMPWNGAGFQQCIVLVPGRSSPGRNDNQLWSGRDNPLAMDGFCWISSGGRRR
jgi:phage FluMu gp28-like protein